MAGICDGAHTTGQDPEDDLAPAAAPAMVHRPSARLRRGPDGSAASSTASAAGTDTAIQVISTQLQTAGDITIRGWSRYPRPTGYRDHPLDLSAHWATDQMKVAVPVTAWESFAVTVTV
jgi:hypothetical protein